jgi:hypothetical protein
MNMAVRNFPTLTLWRVDKGVYAILIKKPLRGFELFITELAIMTNFTRQGLLKAHYEVVDFAPHSSYTAM